MIYAIAITAITLAIDLWTDLRRWMNERKINHVRGALLRCIGLIPACWLAGWFSGVLLASYWLFFDGLLATFKGFGFWYAGSTSVFDRLMGRMPVWGRIVAKIGVLAVAAWLYESNK